MMLSCFVSCTTFQGGLFAGDSPYYLWLVPTLAHSITVSIINMIYSKVAEKCTDLENHRYKHGLVPRPLCPTFDFQSLKMRLYLDLVRE